MKPHDEIRSLLQAFQDGYTHRDLTKLDAFMELFTPEAELIGTNGVRPGAQEWYRSRDTARRMIEGDWEFWGDLRLDLESTSIQVEGEAGWISVFATVSKVIGEEEYASFLDSIRKYLDESSLPAEQKLHYILRGGTNTVYEMHRGEQFTWPLRLTAAVVHRPNGWKFAQMHFSYATVHFPDVRLGV